ncbi:hypothetical protein Sango_1228000 [Sesamum angolense]|uniref:Uncharacterized protein n=1 Tax=Sesamum angolense TaxID=2727404 RepID=A0AAE1WXU5_9LAMI|nr:hypothetical protein Sango_1228000 [Sesamum angolense]
MDSTNKSLLSEICGEALRGGVSDCSYNRRFGFAFSGCFECRKLSRGKKLRYEFEEIVRLSEKSHFTINEVEALHELFKKLSSFQSLMTKQATAGLCMRLWLVISFVRVEGGWKRLKWFLNFIYFSFEELQLALFRTVCGENLFLDRRLKKLLCAIPAAFAYRRLRMLDADKDGTSLLFFPVLFLTLRWKIERFRDNFLVPVSLEEPELTNSPYNSPHYSWRCREVNQVLFASVFLFAVEKLAKHNNNPNKIEFGVAIRIRIRTKMADKPSRALVLYGDGLARFISPAQTHLHSFASRACCGFLALPHSPPSASFNALQDPKGIGEDKSEEKRAFPTLEERHYCPMLLAQYQKAVTRVDTVESFTFRDIIENGGNLVIPADRVLHEVAFKLWKAPKYGA